MTNGSLLQADQIAKAFVLWVKHSFVISRCYEENWWYKLQDTDQMIYGYEMITTGSWPKNMKKEFSVATFISTTVGDSEEL